VRGGQKRELSGGTRPRGERNKAFRGSKIVPKKKEGSLLTDPSLEQRGKKKPATAGPIKEWEKKR